MDSIELLHRVRSARKAAHALDKEGRTEEAAQLRAQVAELTATLNSAVAVESAPRREKELTRQMQLMAALNRAVADIRRLGILV